MKVGDVITLTKEEFLVKAKQGLVVYSNPLYFFYSHESTERFVTITHSSEIPGYVYGYSTSEPQDSILGFWRVFPGKFTVRRLPKTGKLLKPRKATNDN